MDMTRKGFSKVITYPYARVPLVKGGERSGRGIERMNMNIKQTLEKYNQHHIVELLEQLPEEKSNMLIEQVMRNRL